MNMFILHKMTAQLVIPIQAGPKLSQAELDAFIERHAAKGQNPDEVLAALIVDAIRASGKAEGTSRETVLAA